MKLCPTSDRVFVAAGPPPLPGMRPAWGTVVAVGPKAVSLEPGDRVALPVRGEWREVDDGGVRVLIVGEGQIEMVTE